MTPKENLIDKEKLNVMKQAYIIHFNYKKCYKNLKEVGFNWQNMKRTLNYFINHVCIVKNSRENYHMMI